MIDDAEIHHGLSPGQGRVLLERTGGNLGVALAMEARSRGYELTLVTDPQASPAKRRLAEYLGATVIDRGVSYPWAHSNGEVIDLLRHEEPSKYLYLNQFQNPANPQAHQTGTGKEIVETLRAAGYPPDCTAILVTGMGTGATMRGVSSALKGWFTRVVTAAVQPPNCNLLEGRYGDHQAYGIAVGEPAPFMSAREVDLVVAVTDREIALAHERLVHEHKILVGPSSAANVAALGPVLEHAACQAQTRVCITFLFDRGEDYL